MATTISVAWNRFTERATCGGDRSKMLRAMHLVVEIIREYKDPYLLTSAESVALAKKVLSRALQNSWTRAEVETFLKG